VGRYLKLAHEVAKTAGLGTTEHATTPTTTHCVVEECSEPRGRENSRKAATKATNATKVQAHVIPMGCDRSDRSDQRRLTRILTLREVLAEINRQDSGPAKNAELFRQGALTEDKAVEYVAGAILHRLGESIEGWRVHAPTVRAALTHAVECDCEVCL
jgi:hypothetical protein